MHSSEHNRAVALARWARVRERERAAFGGHEVAVAKAALCGFLAGDGNIKRRLAPEGFYRYYINCFPDDDEMLAAYLRFFYEVYAKAPRVTPMQGYFAVKCSHQSIGEDILKFAQFGIHTWSIPNFRTSIEKIAWLRAFFSAEGYVGVKSVRIQTVNARGMNEISVCLKELAIHHNCYLYKPKNANHSTVHIITILRFEARLRYARIIGFWHKKKTAALRKTLDLKDNFES